MKNLGTVLMILGAIVMLCYYSMDTTVTTEARDFGYGVRIPSVTVNNIGLMEERRNGMILGGILIIVGAIFFGSGSTHESKNAGVPVYTATRDQLTPSSAPPSRKCPYCAEDIKVEAILCRFCNREVPLLGAEERNTADLSPEQLADLKKDPDRLAAHYGIEKDGNLFRVNGKHFERLFDAVAHAEITALKRKLQRDIISSKGTDTI